MGEFLINNIGTIAVGAAVLVLIFLAARRMILDKKQGKSSCGGGCGSCPNAGLCHGAKQGGQR